MDWRGFSCPERYGAFGFSGAVPVNCAGRGDAELVKNVIYRGLDGAEVIGRESGVDFRCVQCPLLARRPQPVSDRSSRPFHSAAIQA
jgi:hypothetical protein